MKNLLLIILSAIVIILLLLTYKSCKSPHLSNNLFVIENWDDLDSGTQNEYENFILNKYFDKIEGRNSYHKDNGAPLLRSDAIELINEYNKQYGDIGTMKRDTATKSIYFEGKEITQFLDTLRKYNLACGTIGIRFYLAKYPNHYGPNPNLSGHNTIVMRGVCDGSDIAHFPDEKKNYKNVARNYGDVCPPVCDLDHKERVCKKGDYNPNGAFVIDSTKSGK